MGVGGIEAEHPPELADIIVSGRYREPWGPDLI